MTNRSTADLIRSLLAEQRFAVLATQGGGAPNSSLAVDNRTNSADDYRGAAALTVMGLTSVDPTPGEMDRRSFLLQRHPTLLAFWASRIAASPATRSRSNVPEQT